MIGRRSTIGLALLCAFAFCAFAAQSAMAQIGAKSTNTTAFTCVKDGGNLDFSDAHCDNKVEVGKGEYGHEPITKDETTEIEVTTDKTKDQTTLIDGKEVLVKTDTFTPSKLNAILGGVNTEVTCNKVATTKDKEGKSLSKIHNVESEAGKKHTVTGTVQVAFSECTVVKPLKCKVAEGAGGIVTTAEFQGVEGLKPGGKDMGLEFVGEGASKEFAQLTFEDNGGKCPIANGGKPFIVLGAVISTSNVEQGNTHAGATSVYTPLAANPASEKEKEEGMQTLTIGGKQADFKGTFTTTMFGGGDPIALTTVT